MEINEVLKARRLELNLAELDVCGLTGLTVYEYGDLESYPDEFFDCLSWGQAKKVCKVLSLDIKNLLPGYPKEDDGQLRVIPRNVLVTNERKKNGLTKAELADQIGYETIAIEQVEAESDHLDSMSTAAVLDIAKVLKINPCLLV